MRDWLIHLPAWASAALIGVVVAAASYAAGQVLRAIGFGRLSAFARRTSGKWDDVVVEEVSRRVPVWSLLVGLYVATAFWQLPPRVGRASERALLALAVTSLTLAGAAIASRLIVLRDGPHAPALTGLTRNVVKGSIIALGVLMILNAIGVSITPILTALGVGGLALALALQDTLSNLFAGFYIIVARQVRVGDYIRLQSGEEGFVADIGWRATTMRMLPNNLILVPNGKLSQSIVTNFNLPDRELAVLVELGVDYSSDLKRVEAVTCEVAREVMREVAGGVPGFEPFVRYNEFADSSVKFTVILRGQTFVDQYLIRHEFIKRLHARYAAEEITIPFPIRTVVTRSDVART